MRRIRRRQGGRQRECASCPLIASFWKADDRIFIYVLSQNFEHNCYICNALFVRIYWTKILLLDDFYPQASAFLPLFSKSTIQGFDA
jgi:hypothetical protein